MPALRHTLTPLCAAIAAACVSYEPAPVDLAAHAATYAERMPDLAAARAFANATGLAKVEGAALTRHEARALALWFHPSLRRARAEADVARAVADHSGLWPDPTVQGSVADKLGNTNPWLVTSAVGLTIPLSGQFGLQQQLADTKHGTARLMALAREVEVRDGLDAAWVRWSCKAARADALAELCATLDDLDRIATKLAAAQQITRAQARLFALESTSRRAELMATRADAAIARSLLDEMLGLPPGAQVPLQAEWRIESRAPSSDDDATWVDGPRLAAKKRAHAEAERQLELAVSKQYPMLSLFPGWEEEDAINRPAIAFSLPIPLWNRNQLAIAEATAQRDAAKAALEAGYEELAQARLRADVARKAAAQRREQLESTLVPACKEQLADNRRLAELGELDPLLLLDAVTRLYEAQRSALEAAADEADAIAAENSLFWPQEAAPQALAEAQATNLQPNPR